MANRELQRPGPEQIGQLLAPFPSPHRRPEPWSLIRRRGKSENWCGEIRSSADLDVLPADVYLRALFLIDELGPVVRWVDNDRVPRGERVTHEELDAGDGKGNARSGYMRWNPAAGLLRVP